ncbi:DUF4326 domain-containing protein [Streptomyces sp. DSM 41014]|uniref:DUF4326 domain-containing protein n=1 Tax=Streptomyces hintoniae TaxID=3075521 RepID=A0ABU2UXL5_9ACTN|nr:DUF4326 domain-containing protein [Streptomyces sp. DSM 41014]MDT0478039.1 DUF4326 domain-containing protein [Streptomyces sp. DSM 41014]
MNRRKDPREMNGGYQLTMFDNEPEPATQAGPAPAGDVGQSPIGDWPAAATTVVDLHGHQGDAEFADVVYVGRPMFQGGWRLHGHVLANPFKVGKHGDAAAVVERYRAWLQERPQLVARELPKLRGRRLGCWCAEGQPCHARVLAELADQGVKA